MRNNYLKTPDFARSANILAEKLLLWNHCNGVVFAVSKRGSQIAEIISEKLSLPLEIVFCESIADPSDPMKTIGSVCVREAITHANQYDLPQDYLAHQVRMLQRQLQHECGLTEDLSIAIENKVVIVTDDMISNSDELLATIAYVRKYNPLEIIVAVSTIEVEAMKCIEDSVDELFYVSTFTGNPMNAQREQVLSR